MRIAMVSEHANPLAALGGVDAGGQNLHVAELSAALSRAGHDVVVYTRRDDPGQPGSVCAPAGYRVVHVAAGPPCPVPKDDLLPHMTEFADGLRDAWRADPPDIVHSHFWMSGMVSVAVGRDLGIPVAHTYHALGTVKRRYQGAADTSPAERIGVERAIGRGADRIIATCGDEVFELVRMGVPRSRISIVPCGVDVDMFTVDGPKAPKPQRHRVVGVGRLVPRKGFDALVAAVAALPGAELVIAGGPDRCGLADDPEARRLVELAERHGVADRVRLLGQVSRDAMPALLRSADVVACVPWYEPFGIVPLEAMACGVPVVATAVGGLRDTVIDGRTGRHVPPEDHAALVEALRSLLRDPCQRKEFGAAGRARVLARYAWPRVATDTVRAYQRIEPATSGPAGLAGERR